MTWSRIAALGALAVMVGGQARAEDAKRGSGGIEDPARVGQPGGAERSPSVGSTPARPRELSGTFVKADSTTVYLEHMGAIVPLKVDEKTRYTGEGVKSSRDLTEGQEVRASFSVKGTTNVADKLEVASAAGRRPAEAGGETPPRRPDAMPPGPRVPPDRAPAPKDPGSPVPVEPGTPPAPKY
jgi:hypothetical protein